MQLRSKKNPTDRFFSKVNKSSGVFGEDGNYKSECWLWTGKLTSEGYGTFRFSGKGSYTGPAHRYIYQLYNGFKKYKFHIDHLCRVRHCVNPSHLEEVTLVQNVMRGQSFSAINARKTHCIHGHELAGSNLYIQPSTGYRYCKTCKRDSERRLRG